MQDKPYEIANDQNQIYLSNEQQKKKLSSSSNKRILEKNTLHMVYYCMPTKGNWHYANITFYEYNVI